MRMKPVALSCAFHALLAAAPASVSFSQPSSTIDVYDYVEIAATVSAPDANNCFTDASLTGSFARASAAPLRVEGFCDAANGSVYRIRFMPSAPGDYRYDVEFRQGAFHQSASGGFRAVASQRK